MKTFYISKQALSRLIILSYCIIFIILLLVAIQNINSKGVSPYKKQIESDIPRSLLLNDPNDMLYNSVIKSDYATFQNRLRDYVTFRDGSPVSQVTIKKVEAPIREGSTVNVYVSIPELQEENLLVVFDYNANIFSIPSKNYSIPFYGLSY